MSSAMDLESNRGVKQPNSGQLTDEPPTKKARLDEDESNMGFGFDLAAFSDHRFEVRIEDQPDVTRTIHVSKLLVASKSLVLRSKIEAGNPSSEIALLPGQKIEHFVDLLRWMYTSTFEFQGPELGEVMIMAHQFKAKKALEACAAGLARDMTVANACGFLDKGVSMKKQFPENETEFHGFAQLWEQSKTFLRQKFRDLTLGTQPSYVSCSPPACFSAPEFHGLSEEGLKAVLQCDELHIGTENSVFAALQQWIHVDFENRKHSALQLLQYIKFPLIQKNFLLDVIRTEAELDYPTEVKKVFAKKIIEAYVFHCTSPERIVALPGSVNVPTPRNYDERLLQETFEWSIPDIKDQKEVWSPPFFLGGYFLYLLMQRKNPKGPKGGTVGLYMHLKVKDTGLGQDFYIPLAFELLVKTKITGQYVSSKGAYASPFSWSNRAWGYVDILALPWEDFLKADCNYNHDGTLHVKAIVWFKDYWDKLNGKKGGL